MKTQLAGAAVPALCLAALLAAPAAPAHAATVKVAGDYTDLALTSSVKKSITKQKVTVSAVPSAKTVGKVMRFPLTKGRWDFAERDGSLEHLRGNTGLRFQARGTRRSVALIDPRIVVTNGTRGYVTANITNERFKVFRFTLKGSKVSETASAQTISNIKLVTTKAAAVRINRGTKRKALKAYGQLGVLAITVRKPAGQETPTNPSNPSNPTAPQPNASAPGGRLALGSGLLVPLPAGSTVGPSGPAVAVDTNGDGQPEVGVFSLPLKSGTINATTGTGSVQLDGGLLITAPNGTTVSLDQPEVVLGANQGLYALVNGVRVRVADVNLDAQNLSVADGLVTLRDLDLRISTEGAPLLNTLLGTVGITAGSQLANLQLVVPQA